MIKISKSRLRKDIKTSSKLLGVSFVVGVLVFSSFLSLLPTNKTQASLAPYCYYGPKTNRTIIHFDGTELWASHGAEKAVTKAIGNFTIPEGKYNVYLLSYDDNHASKPTQNNESWYLKLKNSQGTNVAITPAIDDLPNAKNYLSQKVASSLLVQGVGVAALAVHAAYPTSTDKVNSITPVCAAFDKIEPPANPNLTIVKSVRNLTNGSSWQNSVSAKPGDQVQFRVKINSTGSTTAKNVYLKDDLPYKLSYVAGSTSGGTTSDITSGWTTLGNMSAGSSKTVYLKADVSDKTYFSVGTTTLTNTARTYATNVSTLSDTANVLVNKKDVPKEDPNLDIVKSVRNLTNGDSSWHNSVYAKPGDEIEFRIEIESTGDATAQNVYVRDYLPNKLNYDSGSTHGATSSNITSGWRNIGDIDNGDSTIIYFRVFAEDEDYFSSSTTTLTNTAKAYADDVSTVEDEATVKVEKESNNDVDLQITKSVRNNTDGDYSWHSSVYAHPGDEVEFQIKIENTGNDRANNVYVRDYLPSKLSYISGSVHGATTSNITTGWKAIGDINDGDSEIIYFSTKVYGETYFSSTIETLVNEAKTYADEVTTREDDARVFVRQNNTPELTELTISKLGRNVTEGQLGLTDYVNAAPNQIIEFSIQVTNTGDTTLKNLKIWDNLPNNLEYISGSTTVDGSYQSDGIISGGIYLGSIGSGQSKTIKFQVKVSSFFAPTGSSSATINVDNHTVQASNGISVSKLGRNISQGQSNWLTSVPASLNDELEFSIKIVNVSNNDLSNVKIKEVLPANLSIISGSTSVDGILLGGDITGAGLNLGTLSIGQEKNIKFRARVTSGTGTVIAPTTLVNTAYASADEVSTIQDQASVIVSQSGQVLGATTIETGPAETIIWSLTISLLLSVLAYFLIKNKAQLKLRLVTTRFRLLG